MTATIYRLPRKPVEATSPYLNAPLRPLAEVLSLRQARQAAEPRAERPETVQRAESM